jgi:hypothetical protein
MPPGPVTFTQNSNMLTKSDAPTFSTPVRVTKLNEDQQQHQQY